ncbi:intradiol ring-cleavage dioxygenase [Citricoccus sp. NR2]|uniref:intradiol ring-cleavage dioxygenase n=1 Tax=Citricoccus sp. NR2 TaxID=3004095 RepID=UPI0022DDE82E|nr:intradiol ring-cleavage dioxygenase [Citricoccus sp. NR2]WBL19828.1 intradiol ring-cleavage dioxygenase [Citricoccus sp. NR2]
MTPLFRPRRSADPSRRGQQYTAYPTASEHDDVESGTTPTTGTGIPTFEGRPLDRPHEDIEDQGLAFDLTTAISRRRALGIFGVGAGALALAACAPTSSSTTSSASTSASATASASASASSASATDFTEEMPGETAGPYPGDGSNGQDVLEISGVERSDIRSSIDGGATADGVKMTLTMNIVDMVNSNGPMTGAAVYVWHCDAVGEYSMYSAGLENETYLRGVQVVGDDGTVTFTTIFPGCYAGRWPHIHFEVFPDIDSITDAGNAVLTSQIALPEAESEAVYADSRYTGSAQNLSGVTLETDNVFSDGWDLQVPEVSGSVSSGYTVRIDVPIDTSTEPEAGGMPGDGGGGEMGQGGPGGAPPSN